MKLSTVLCLGLTLVLLSDIIYIRAIPSQPDNKSLGAGQVPTPASQLIFTDWRLVTQSTFILEGPLEVPVQALKKTIASKKNRFLILNVRVRTALKGHPNKALIPVRFYSEAEDYDPSIATLLKLNQKEVLVFLHHSDALYFAGYTPTALQPIDKKVALQVRKEVENQRSILAHFAKSSEAQPDSYDSQVKTLIAAMLIPQTEQNAFDKLVALGPAAVPATIRLMDDRRRLPIQSLMLRNTAPNSFEEFAHYGPVELVDALSTLAGRMASEGFGDLENGGSDMERQSAVSEWRIYLHYLVAQKAVSGAEKLP